MRIGRACIRKTGRWARQPHPSGGPNLFFLFFLGIDISKDWFDAALALLQEGRSKPSHKRFSNNTQGFEQLAAWLKNRAAGQVHACLEATGTYGQAVAVLLHEQGHSVQGHSER